MPQEQEGAAAFTATVLAADIEAEGDEPRSPEGLRTQALAQVALAALDGETVAEARRALKAALALIDGASTVSGTEAAVAAATSALSQVELFRAGLA